VGHTRSDGWVVSDKSRNRSDIHFWKTGAIGTCRVEGDCILGHEAAGVVLRVGEGVRDLKAGKERDAQLQVDAVN